MPQASSSKILIVEDTPAMSVMYAAFLADGPYSVATVGTGREALAHIRAELPAAILLDIHLPDMSGLEVLRIIQEESLPCACIVITAHGTINLAVEAMQAGARDFIVKPFSKDRLQVTLKNVLSHVSLERMVETLKDDLGRDGYHGMVGSSLAMQAVYRTIESVAPSRATVFVTGESGTGKELCAEAIHSCSPRANKPFVAINCGAIPRDLMESEIFGHIKGAFTGAANDREGAARRADGGTLFLDEICEMDMDLQTKLLRFIQSGLVQKVGGDLPDKVDVRFICATNKDPWAEVEKGNFREDLYYRLHVIPLNMPPLRERDSDVVEIARSLLERLSREEGKTFTRFSKAAESRLLSFHWPGNVRQLQNVIRNVVVLNDADVVEAEMFPDSMMPGFGNRPEGDMPVQDAPVVSSSLPPANGGVAVPVEEEDIQPLWQTEKNVIEAAIAACDGNVPRAAACLGISASTIYRKKMTWDAA